MEFTGEEEEIIPKSRGPYSEKYTDDSLREAIEKIQNNELSYGAASRIYNVPKTTLHNKMKNPVSLPRGAATILSKEQEDELAEWVLLHADFGDPRTKQDIIIAAAEIAQLDDSSSNFKNGTPTSGWIDGFFKRHPSLRYRTPQAISKASAINTKDDFSGLWRNIYDYFKRTNQLDLLNRPELWWNADETCFEKDKIPKKVVARRGVKRVSRREMGPPKDNTTVTYAFSAAGDYVEPLITLKDSNSSVAEIAFALGSVGANYGINQTESGWTRKESFYYFVSMHLYNQWERKNVPKPRILAIDGYGAHFSLKLFRWSRQNGVIIIVLYPGATPYMQMCDTTMFSPMKQKHSQLYSQWRLKNPTTAMNDVEFVKLLKQINDAVIKKESIINGWRATGLQPFNFNNLKVDGLLTKSSNRVYDFKGYFTEPSILNTADVGNRQINAKSNVVVHPSSELYMNQQELLNKIRSTKASEEGLVFGRQQENNNNTGPVQITCSGSPQQENNNDNECDIDMSICVYDSQISPNELLDNWQYEHSDVHVSSFEQRPASFPIELIDVDIAEIAQGPIPSQDNSCIAAIAITPNRLTLQENSLNLHEYPTVEAKRATIPPPLNDGTRCDVKLSELAGHNEIFQSTFEAKFNLAAFGLTDEAMQVENSSKIGRIIEKIRRDVKQLGILCAAGDIKEKLINVLVINQQLNIIDPRIVEPPELEPSSSEPRTIRSILKPPTMPERIKPKRNLNLKISYGVVTAEEVVQSIFDREEADRQHEIEREQEEIAKHERENAMKDVDDELKELRHFLSTARAENLAANKETAQKKKNKTLGSSELAVQEAAKNEREKIIKLYDEQLRDLREKMKTLKSNHVEENKKVLLKRKNFELQKKEMGNKVQPPVAPLEIDESLDFE